MERRDSEFDRRGDLLTATSEHSYKCTQCGNMFSMEAEATVCDVCGNDCAQGTCEIVYASNQDY